MAYKRPNNWMVVHSSGATMEQLTRSAEGKNVMIAFDDDRHDISLQGPKAVDFRASHTPMDSMPCSFTCLDIIRVEANLMFFEFDMTENDTPWNVGLAFTISRKKEADYRGKAAVMASMNEQTTTIYGLISDCDTTMDLDAGVFVDDKKVGYVTAPLLSTVMNKSIAMFRVDLEYAKPGIEVEVRGENVTCKAVTAATPLYDSKKGKRTT